MLSTLSNGSVLKNADSSNVFRSIDVKHFWRPAQVRRLLKHRFTENFLTLLISINFVVCIVEADNSVGDAEPPTWMIATNYIFSVSYTAETLMRIYAFRSKFWKDGWWVTDAFVVFIDDACIVLGFVIGNSMPNVSMMRLLRLLRLSRSKRILKLVPEFYLQVECMLGAFKPMCWGLLLIALTMLIFSVIAVLLIHPINAEVAASGIYEGCDRCPRAYESVAMSMLTTSQHLLLGDSWGAVSIPIIEHQPLAVTYFVLIYIVMCLILLNSILGAVVDAAGQARNENDRFIASEKETERRIAHERLLRTCTEMDADQSGTISKDELMNGVSHNDDFAALLRRMDIEVEDLDIVWNLLDSDKSGSVDYKEFVHELFKMRSNDQRTMLVFIRYYVLNIRAQLEEELRRVNEDVVNRLTEVARLEKKEIEMLDSGALRRGRSELGKNSRTLRDAKKDAEDNTFRLNHKASPPEACIFGTESVAKLTEPPKFADVQNLLQSHWEKQQKMIAEFVASFSTPAAHMQEKDEPKDVQGNKMRHLAQSLSTPVSVSACEPGTESVAKRTEPPQLADVQTLLKSHVEKQQKMITDLAASFNTPASHMQVKDEPKDVRGNEVRHLAQPLSTPVSVSACEPGDGPPEPASPGWHLKSWPE